MTSQLASGDIISDRYASALYDLASEFHSYYSKIRIITEDINYSRVYLINSVQKVLKNGLDLLNVSAPTKM